MCTGHMMLYYTRQPNRNKYYITFLSEDISKNKCTLEIDEGLKKKDFVQIGAIGHVATGYKRFVQQRSHNPFVIQQNLRKGDFVNNVKHFFF